MKLYKYKSSKTIKRDFPLLEKNQIWFSKVGTLNDPYEGTFIIDEKYRNAFNFIFYNKRNLVQELFKARIEVANVQNKMAGILSLTTDKDNLLMWSHYAENHEGYILEYDINSQSFNPIGEHAKYNNNVQLIKIKYTNKPISQDIRHKAKFSQLFNKSKCWNYEKEYRFIAGFYGKYEYERKSLKAIYLGANSSKELESIFYDFCIGKNISLFKARIPYGSFLLEFEKIH